MTRQLLIWTVSLALTALCLFSCYGINEKTSEISNINYVCPKDTWTKIISFYSVDSIKDEAFKLKATDFKNKPFPTDVIYFNETPKELIGISDDRYAVRYVYNPNLDDEILDGLSSKLNQNEKERIAKRIQNVLEKFNCKENK